MNKPTRIIPWHVRVRVAAAAQADPRTVTRFCQGFTIRGMVGERIEKALRAEGILLAQQGKTP